MTNKEKYKQAFSVLHASTDVRKEDIMKKKSAYMAKRIAVAAIALVVGFAGSNGVCYAATGETWVEKVFVKVNGVEREATVTEFEDGTVCYGVQLEPYQDGENRVDRYVEIITEKENIEDISITCDESGHESIITIVNEAENAFDEDGEGIAIVTVEENAEASADE